VIWVTRYVRCDACRDLMIGIMSSDARETCHGCGGRAIIGNKPRYRDRIRRAKERMRPEPPRPRTPGPRRSYGIDAA
jgi:hypothetical protein